MDPITMISHIRLAKLNNAEYAAFAQSTINNILGCGGYLKIGIPREVFDSFMVKTQLLNDIVSQSRTSDETVRIADADARCDHALSYLIGQLRDGRMSPIAADREAYTSLYNTAHPYRKARYLPRRQQIAQTTGLIKDLTKEANNALVNKLGMGPAVSALESANDAYAELLESRAAGQVAAELPAAVAVREELTAIYDTMMTLVLSTSVVTPNEFTAAFIPMQNKLIDDTNAAYNLRMGLHDYWKRKKEEEQEEVEAAAQRAALLAALLSGNRPADDDETGCGSV